MASTMGAIEAAMVTSIKTLSSPTCTAEVGYIKPNINQNCAFVACEGGDSELQGISSTDEFEATVNIVVVCDNRDNCIDILEQLEVLWLDPTAAPFTALNAQGVIDINGKQVFYPMPVGGSKHMDTLRIILRIDRVYI